jgi:hypothetical protein
MLIVHTADSLAAGVAACRLISSNVSRKTPLFSINLGWKWAMFSSQSVYVLEPLHLERGQSGYCQLESLPLE